VYTHTSNWFCLSNHWTWSCCCHLVSASCLKMSSMCFNVASVWILFVSCHIVLLYDIFFYAFAICVCSSICLNCVSHVYMSLPLFYPCCLFLSREVKWSKKLQWDLFINYFGWLFILENYCFFFVFFLLALQGLLF